jgi:zinc transport system substrate-binding protein
LQTDCIFTPFSYILNANDLQEIMVKGFIGASLIFAVGLLAFASGSKESAMSPDSSVSAQCSVKPMIAVSILPQDYFVRRIGGDKVSTVVLVGPGQDPHSYDPTPRQMAELAKARAWILSNTDFEISLKPKVASQYPSLMLVDGTQGVQFRQMEGPFGRR